MKKGLFISLEGGEGAGKTTVAAQLVDYFQRKGHDVTLTREPGGIEIAEQIRSVILNPANTKMDGRTEALLYAAARRQHLVERILPALGKGNIVLCDRFIDSSLAYQGYARQLGVEDVWQINQFAMEHCLPDVTFYFDLPPEVGLARIHADQDREVNRLDMEKIEFHQKVREGYLQIAHQFSDRIVVVDAVHPVEWVVEQVKRVIEERLNNNSNL